MGTIGEGGGRLTPEMKAFYKEKFEESVNLFDKSLQNYHEADFAEKKNRFKSVMDKALEVMNEAAKAGIGHETKRQAVQLEKDYYENMPNSAYNDELSEEAFDKLKADIENLKKSF